MVIYTHLLERIYFDVDLFRGYAPYNLLKALKSYKFSTIVRSKKKASKHLSHLHYVLHFFFYFYCLFIYEIKKRDLAHNCKGINKDLISMVIEEIFRTLQVTTLHTELFIIYTLRIGTFASKQLIKLMKESLTFSIFSYYNRI